MMLKAKIIGALADYSPFHDFGIHVMKLTQVIMHSEYKFYWSDMQGISLSILAYYTGTEVTVYHRNLTKCEPILLK